MTDAATHNVALMDLSKQIGGLTEAVKTIDANTRGTDVKVDALIEWKAAKEGADEAAKKIGRFVLGFVAFVGGLLGAAATIWGFHTGK